MRKRGGHRGGPGGRPPFRTLHALIATPLDRRNSACAVPGVGGIPGAGSHTKLTTRLALARGISKQRATPYFALATVDGATVGTVELARPTGSKA